MIDYVPAHPSAVGPRSSALQEPIARRIGSPARNGACGSSSAARPSRRRSPCPDALPNAQRRSGIFLSARPRLWARLYQSECPTNCSCYLWTFKRSKALGPSRPATKPGALVMSIIPLDLERRCEQRSAASFSAARALKEQHRLERQQHQQLTAPDKSKSKARRVESAGLTSVLTGRREPVGA
jgi:hypothetical protein